MLSSNGEFISLVYSVCIGSPGVKKEFTDILVNDSCYPESLKGKIVDEDIFDVIIGMDIIKIGDFSFKNENSKYIFTFDLH